MKMRFLVLFSILILFVSYSEQQRRFNYNVIRNLEEDADFVQRYEETPPLRIVRKRLPAKNLKLQRIEPVKRERKIFKVLLLTPNGFNEKSGYAITNGR